MRKALQHLKSADPVLGAIIERVGRCKMTHTEPVFGSLVRSIVFQQLSGKAASTILGRLIEATGSPIRPEAILKLSPEKLRSLGLSTQKATYVRDLAEKTATGVVRFERLPKLQNERIIEELTQVKGIGVWTAQMFLMFSLKRPNVLPVLDLGIRNAVKKAYGLEEMPSAQEIEAIAAAWHPYCTIASWYLWRSLEPD